MALYAYRKNKTTNKFVAVHVDVHDIHSFVYEGTQYDDTIKDVDRETAMIASGTIIFVVTKD